MRGVRRCEDDDWDGFEVPLQALGSISLLYGDEDEVRGVLLDQHGRPFPRPPKLVGYERRECRDD